MTRVFAFCLALLTALPAMAQTVRIGTDGAYPPYTFIDDNQQLAGFDIELGNRLCEIANLTCEWVVSDWETMLDDLNNGKFDAAMGGIANTEIRRKIVAFSYGYQRSEDQAAYAGLALPDNFDTARIAVQVNTKHAQILANQGIEFIPYPTVESALNAVMGGDVDMMFGSLGLLEDLRAQSDFKLKILKKIKTAVDETAIAFRKSDIELREKFNAAIEGMTRDGTLKELLHKWFSTTTET